MTQPFHAVVLAGDRKPGDPVAAARGVPAKALAPVAGRPMVLRVLDALAASGAVAEIVLCGPDEAAVASCPDLVEALEAGRARWIPPQPSPSRSAGAGIETLPAEAPVLLTTADHALLSPAMVSHFTREAAAQGVDAAVGLVRHDDVIAAWPDTRRTVTRFRDRGYCGCNLFAFPAPAGRRLVPLWQRVEENRKQPWRVIAGLLGPKAILDYTLGRLSLSEALERLSARLELRAGAVILPFPEAGIDVDSIGDLALAERILGGQA